MMTDEEQTMPKSKVWALFWGFKWQRWRVEPQVSSGDSAGGFWSQSAYRDCRPSGELEWMKHNSLSKGHTAYRVSFVTNKVDRGNKPILGLGAEYENLKSIKALLIPLETFSVLICKQGFSLPSYLIHIALLKGTSSRVLQFEKPVRCCSKSTQSKKAF